MVDTRIFLYKYRENFTETKHLCTLTVVTAFFCCFVCVCVTIAFEQKFAAKRKINKIKVAFFERIGETT